MARVEISHVVTRGAQLTVTFKGPMYAGKKFDPLVVLIERELVRRNWTRQGFDTRKGQMNFHGDPNRRDITTDELKDWCLKHATDKVAIKFHRAEATLFTSGEPRTPAEVDRVRRLKVTLDVEATGELPFGSCDADVIKQIDGITDVSIGVWNEVLTVTWYTNGRDPWSEAIPIQAAIRRALA